MPIFTSNHSSRVGDSPGFLFKASDRMPDYLFTSFSGIGFPLSILTAYVIYKSPNSPWAAMILAAWIFTWNFLYFIDSIIWGGDNPEDWWDGNIYCDVNSRIKDAIAPGIPGAAIGVFRFLANTVEHHVSQRVNNTFENNIIDFVLGFILPVVIAGVRLIVMPSRYQIWGVSGCMSIVDDSWPSILVWYIWPPVLSVITAIYAGFFLWRWWPIRKRLSRDWSLNTSDGISQVEFLRILVTVSTVIVVYLPLSIVGFVKGVLRPRHPYSFEDIYGPQWAIIVKRLEPPGFWGPRIGPLLAIQLFCLMGITKNARQLFELGIEWIYDHWASKFQVSWMQKISAKCKQSRLAGASDLEL